MLCTPTNIQNKQENYDSNCLKPICPFAPKFYRRIINQIWNNSHNFNHKLSFVVKSVIPYLITPLFGKEWGESRDLRNLSMTAVGIHKYINAFTLKYALTSGHSLEFLDIKSSTEDIVKFIVNYNVTHLDLKGFPNITEEHIKLIRVDQFHSISKDSKSIETYLTIRYCTSEDFLDKLKHGHNLQEIDFCGTAQIDEDTLEKLTGYYPEFVKFPLGAIKYTIDGLLNFAKCCPNLMDLDFSPRNVGSIFDDHISEITDDMLKQLAPLCPHLRNINLGEQWYVTDKGIKAVADNCHELVSIYFICDKILERTLGSFANNCTNLRVMELNSDSEITSKVYKKLKSNCPHLTKIILHLSGNDDVEWNILSEEYAKDYLERSDNSEDIKIFEEYSNDFNRLIIKDFDIIDNDQNKITMR